MIVVVVVVVVHRVFTTKICLGLLLGSFPAIPVDRFLIFDFPPNFGKQL